MHRGLGRNTRAPPCGTERTIAFPGWGGCRPGGAFVRETVWEAGWEGGSLRQSVWVPFRDTSRPGW